MQAEVVLLKNQRILPLSLSSSLTIAVVGSACNAKQNITKMLDQLLGGHQKGSVPMVDTSMRWDLGSYYTVGGSGRVIPENPVPSP